MTEPSDGPKRWIGRFLMENLLATARSSVAFVSKGFAMSSAMQRRGDIPLVLLAYTTFSGLATVFAVATMFSERLRVMMVPYTGWMGLLCYSFTIFFAAVGCYYQFPPAVTAVKSMLKLFIVIGTIEFTFHVVSSPFGGQDFKNPYLTYSNLRPCVTIGLPAFWLAMLAYESRNLACEAPPNTETNNPMNPSGGSGVS